MYVSGTFGYRRSVGTLCYKDGQEVHTQSLQTCQSVLAGLLFEGAGGQLGGSGGRGEVARRGPQIPAAPVEHTAAGGRGCLIIAGRRRGRLWLENGGHPGRVRLPTHVLGVG